MSKIIKIGHASSSETGTAIGVAGDFTGREVCIVENYDISRITPYIVLRPKNSTIALGSVKACEAGCTNNNIGYSQSGRNTLYNLAKELNFNLSNVGLCNTDCSAFMTVCAIAGGARITYGSNAPTTSNMRTRFTKSGDYDILTSAKYTDKTDFLKAGDILVHENTHTVMVLENGSTTQTDTGSVEPELLRNLQSYNIITKTINVSSSAATIIIKTIKQLNETEIIVNQENWDYFLEYKKIPTGKVSELVITNNEITLTDLTKNTCYLYRIKVKNGSTNLFCSAYKTFNTLADNTAVNKSFTENNNYIDTIYIRTAEDYKSAVININK